jgi:hypothetical protein
VAHPIFSSHSAPFSPERPENLSGTKRPREAVSAARQPKAASNSNVTWRDVCFWAAKCKADGNVYDSEGEGRGEGNGHRAAFLAVARMASFSPADGEEFDDLDGESEDDCVGPPVAQRRRLGEDRSEAEDDLFPLSRRMFDSAPKSVARGPPYMDNNRTGLTGKLQSLPSLLRPSNSPLVGTNLFSVFRDTAPPNSAEPTLEHVVHAISPT